MAYIGGRNMNILVSSFGITWEILAEVLGFVNYQNHDIYQFNKNISEINQKRKEYFQEPADEFWVVGTDSDDSRKKFEEFQKWHTEHGYEIESILYCVPNVDDINSAKAANEFTKYCYEIMYEARKKVGNGGKLYVSIAGGRKTMSSDLTDAAYIFGTDALIHIIDDGTVEREIKFLENPEKYIEPYIPIVTNTYVMQDFFDEINRENVFGSVRELQERAVNQLVNYDTSDSNFKILFQYKKNIIEKLKKTFIGNDPSKEKEELDLLKTLPKCDLHCHLGGALYSDDIFEIIKNFTIPEISISEEKKQIIEKLKKISSAKKIDEEFFSEYQDEESFVNIGIDLYEELGDIQGSTLFQTEEIIAFAVRKLIEHSRSENVRHLEIRCSPMNYTKAGLTGQKVLEVILKTIDDYRETMSVSLLIIASRHGELRKISQSINLIKKMGENKFKKKYFKGFDLAGNEEKRSPKKLRSLFLDIMKDCYNITIHAGETQDVDKIWQAVYHLNAERIGHGLKLNHNQNLREKFLDRKIGVEMCPSSNFQIVGFKDNYFPSSNKYEKYPLKDYLDAGLLVSCNTDNIGISRTNATKELHKAARLTQGGLSLWDILKLIRNSYKIAFVSYDERKKLLADAEKQIQKWIKEFIID